MSVAVGVWMVVTVTLAVLAYMAGWRRGFDVGRMVGPAHDEGG